MEHDSLRWMLSLLETWAAGARDSEIERVIETLKDELSHRGYDIRCEPIRKKGGTQGPVDESGPLS